MAQTQNGDSLGARLDSLGDADPDKAGVLAALATASILVLLTKPPGEGDDRPERNLVRWRDATQGMTFVPLFTSRERIPGSFPPPTVVTRVPFRLLLSLAGTRHYVLNPLSPVRLVLPPARIDTVRDYIRQYSGETTVPSQQVPWGFRRPPDGWYAIVHALANWIAADGRIDRAFLYELLRGEDPPQVVLGLEIPTEPSIAASLSAVAQAVGAPPSALAIRFLPDEPSHAHGVAGMGLEPFYDRPVRSPPTLLGPA